MSLGIDASQAFSPNKLANLVIWFDATDPATIIESGGDVSQWNDKSSSGNNASQGVGALQPRTGDNTFNGKNVITADGTDGMAFDNTLTLSGAYTVFQVTALTSSTVQLIGGVTNNHLPISSSNQTAFYNYGDQGGSFAEVSATQPGSPNIGVAVRTGAGVHSYFLNAADDTVSSTNDARSIAFTQIFRRGAGAGVLGDIGEVFIYSRALTGSERQAAESYLSNKWGISMTFPQIFSSDFSSAYS